MRRAATLRASATRETSRGAPVAGKVKTWVWVVIGVAVMCILGLVAIAAVGLLLRLPAHRDQAGNNSHRGNRVRGREGQLRRTDHRSSSSTGTDDFSALTPIGRRRHTQPSRTTCTSSPSTRPTGASSASAFRSGCCGRRPRNATIDLNGNRMDLEDLRLTVEDLERYGPAVIVDHSAPDGERILVWSK